MLDVPGWVPCHAWRGRTGRVFNLGQRAPVAGAFKLAGYQGPLLVAPVAGEDGRAFLLGAAALQALRHGRSLEQVLQQLLGCKVFVVELNDLWGGPAPFE